MAEYIRREEVLEWLRPYTHEDVLLEPIDVISDIRAIPAADVVDVVRCKDCVNYCGFEHCKNGVCDVDSVSKRAVYPDDFCSYGERKDNG